MDRRYRPCLPYISARCWRGRQVRKCWVSMNADWVLLGYRIARKDSGNLADRWGTSSFLSVSEWMIDMFPNDTDWYAHEQDAFAARSLAPEGFEIIGVGCQRSRLEFLAGNWAAPPAIEGRIYTENSDPIPAGAPVLGYEPVALWYRTVFSWRYFGGIAVGDFLEEARPKLTANGLLESPSESQEVAVRMNDLVVEEGYPWLSLIVFKPC